MHQVPQRHLVWLDGEKIRLLFKPPFNKFDDFLKEVRAVTGRSWDGQHNIFPLSSSAEVRSLAEAWEIPVSPEVELLEGWNTYVGMVKRGLYNVFMDHKSVVITFDYNSTLISVVHHYIPGVNWRGSNGTYRAPETSVNEAIKFAHEFDLTVDPEIEARIQKAVDDAKELYEHSTLLDWDEFEIPGLILPLRPYQRAAVAYMQRVRRCILADQPGLGKGHPHGTKVLTPTGWNNVEDLKIGEFVIGSDGRPTEITGVFPRGELQTYRVSFNDGSSVCVDGDHLWAVQRVRLAGRPPEKWPAHKTRDLFTDFREDWGSLKWKIPIVKPVEFNSSESLPLDPYLLGALLGDGTLGGVGVHFTTSDQFMIDTIIPLLPSGVMIKKTKSNSGYDYSIVRQAISGQNNLRKILDKLELTTKSDGKHIPEIYLRSSKEDRLALLRGLMDTDGSAGLDGTNEFVSTSKELADGITDLVQGLGGVVRRSIRRPSTKNKKSPGEYLLAHRVNVKMNECPFLLPRKAKRWKKPTKYPPSRNIKLIELDEVAPVTCISVAAENNLYVTENYIVTHNTVSSISTVILDKSLPVVVVCKNRLKETLREDFLKFYPNLNITILNGGKRQEIPKSDVVIVNYDIAKQRLEDIKEHGYKSLIVDESHYIKNGKKRSTCTGCGHKVNSNAVNCKGCGKTGIKVNTRWDVRRTDAVMRLSMSLPPEALVLLLTGTPIGIRPGELIRQLECIDRLDLFGGEWRFRKRYCPDNKTALNLQELNTKLRENCFVRRKTSEVYGQLPPIQNSIQRMVLTDEQMKRYNEIEADIVEYLAEKARQKAIDMGEDHDAAYWNKRNAVERAEALVRLNTLRGAIVELKYEAALDWLDTFLETGDEPILVFANRIKIVEGVYNRYMEMAVKVRGDLTNEQVLENVHVFQEQDWCRMLVANTSSAKEGLTLTKASHVAFLELEWNPTDHSQAVSRVYGRTNDPHGAVVYYLLAPGTVDYDMYALLQERQKIVNAVTDGVELDEKQLSIEDHLIKLLTERGQNAPIRNQ